MNIRPRKIDLLYCVPCAKYGTRDAFFFSKNSLTRADSVFFLVQAEMACIDTEEGGCFKGQIGMKGDKRQVINTVMERNQQFFERYIKQQMLSVKNTQKIQKRTQAPSKL